METSPPLSCSQILSQRATFNVHSCNSRRLCAQLWRGGKGLMGINSPDRHLTWQECSLCARNSSPRERWLRKGFLKWTKRARASDGISLIGLQSKILLPCVGEEQGGTEVPTARYCHSLKPAVPNAWACSAPLTCPSRCSVAPSPCREPGLKLGERREDAGKGRAHSQSLPLCHSDSRNSRQTNEL